MADQNPAQHRPGDLGSLPDTRPDMERERQRRADAVAYGEASRLTAQHEGSMPGVRAGYGERAGLPESASGTGRREAVEAGLYQWGEARSRPGVVSPEVPEGETDSWDAEPLPYMRVTRPPGRQAEAEAGE